MSHGNGRGGWIQTVLGDVTDVSGGVTKNAAKSGDLVLPYLRVANVYSGELRLADIATIQVGEAELARTLLKRDDLLLVEGNGSLDQIGRVALWDGSIAPCVHQNHLIKVRCLDPSLPRWLLYYLLSPDGRSAITRAASSTSGLHTLSISKVAGLEVPIGPKGFRVRTIDTLEAHLTRLDAAAEGLKRVEANLKRYRASVLKAAVEGRLVPTEAALAKQEGRPYEPASVLLARILKERRRRWEESELARMKAKGETPKSDKWKERYQQPAVPDNSLPTLPEGWCWATLDAFLERIETGKSFKCLERPPTDSEIGVVKVSAVTWGVYDELESKTCLNPDLVDEDLFVRAGDLLFSRANTIQLVGAVVIACAVTKRVMLSDKILRLRTVTQDCDSWILAVLRSQVGRQQIEALSTGNQESMRNIGQDRIRQICIPLPPAAEIDRVLLALADALSIADESAQTVERAGIRTRRLRQSILKWAFEGKLVDQDPNDEPASVLLARIKAERAAAAAAPVAPRRPAARPKRKRAAVP